MLRVLVVAAAALLLAGPAPGHLASTATPRDLSALQVTAFDPTRLQDYCKKPLADAVHPAYRDSPRSAPLTTGEKHEEDEDPIAAGVESTFLSSLAAVDHVTADFLRHAANFTATWCKDEVFSPDTLLMAFAQPRLEILPIESKTKGVFGRVLGRTLYMAKCKPVAAKIRRTEKCYSNGIPVTDEEGNQLFAAAFTRRLSPNAEEVPCALRPAFKIGDDWIAFSPEPEKIQPPQKLDPMLPLHEQLFGSTDKREDSGPAVQHTSRWTTEDDMERHSLFWNIVSVFEVIGKIVCVYIAISFLYRFIKNSVSAIAKRAKCQKETTQKELVATKGYTFAANGDYAIEHEIDIYNVEKKFTID